jgi:hypothetical protein
LYRRGLISRVEDRVDRRRSLLGLTRTGHSLADTLLVGDRMSLAGSLARLDLADLQGLAQGLRALLALPQSTPGSHATPKLLPMAPGRQPGCPECTAIPARCERHVGATSGEPE